MITRPSTSRRAARRAPPPPCSSLPAEVQDELRRSYEREARTSGTPAYRNRRERTRPWRDLAWLVLLLAIAVLVMSALGADPGHIYRLVSR